MQQILPHSLTTLVESSHAYVEQSTNHLLLLDSPVYTKPWCKDAGWWLHNMLILIVPALEEDATDMQQLCVTQTSCTSWPLLACL